MLAYKTTIRVRYADTDKMSFVYNGKYLEYFEVGRTEMLRNAGLPYSEVEKRGYQLPLIAAGINYKSPAFYDDLLEIEAILDDKPSAKIRIDYVIKTKGTDKLVAEGFTEHMFIRSDTRKPARPPEFYLEAVRLLKTNK